MNGDVLERNVRVREQYFQQFRFHLLVLVLMLLLGGLLYGYFSNPVWFYSVFHFKGGMTVFDDQKVQICFLPSEEGPKAPVRGVVRPVGVPDCCRSKYISLIANAYVDQGNHRLKIHSSIGTQPAQINEVICPPECWDVIDSTWITFSAPKPGVYDVFLGEMNRLGQVDLPITQPWCRTVNEKNEVFESLPNPADYPLPTSVPTVPPTLDPVLAYPPPLLTPTRPYLPPTRAYPEP